MSTQGKAGQFRTPRHIINFIVAVVNPQKHERVLDPACGTAGFLISAYNHILARNKQKSPGDVLSPSERRTLSGNVHGYEIDPGMTRLSRINMFLHNIRSPQIFDYDTLTSEARWNEDYQVILANPPFMTPRGGIHPHPRFAVHAKRSEVLFVDYIAEHLTTSGRAGIIVPEGIIFQTSTAYKTLRAYLIDQWGLYAVASLPSGVFNPYSGVKTSVLFIDKLLAKQSDEILFVRIDNDGFDLGAQRRATDKNDLPQALNILQNWQQGKKVQSDMALWVTKDKIAENGDYTLTADRYREGEDYSNAKYPMVELGDVCEILRGTSITKKDIIAGDIPVIAGGQQAAYYHNQANREGKTITVSGSGAYAGFINFFQTPIFASDCSTIQSLDEDKLLTDFVFYSLKEKQDDVYKLQSGMGQPHVYAKDVKKIQIPLPPLEIQEKIAEEIENYQKIIDGAKQVVKNWKPRVAIDPDWEMVELGDVCEILRGTSITKKDIIAGDIPVIAGGQQAAYYHNQANREGKTITVSGSGAYAGFINFFQTPIFASDCSTIQSLDEDKLLTDFVFYSLKEKQDDVYKLQSGMGQPHVYAKDVKKIKIPLPSLKIQKQIVAEIEKEEAIIHGNTYLIEIMEQKIKDKISEVWDNE